MLASAGANPSAIASASFRDPDGRVLIWRGRVLRLVNGKAFADFNRALTSAPVQEAVQSGKIIGTRMLSHEEGRLLLAEPDIAEVASTISGPVAFEHDAVEFPTFPYEWIPEMLAEAGSLTIDLAQNLGKHGLGLKDATPYNVLFQGARPVLVDVLSIEQRDPRDPTWLPYSQFVRTFLLPLLAYERFGLSPDQIYLGRRDGLDPEDLYRWASWLDRLRPSLLPVVTLPALLASKAAGTGPELYRQRLSDSPEKARFILESLLKGLSGRVASAQRRMAGNESHWSRYEEETHDPAYFEKRDLVVREALERARPRRVLDVGANTGRYSRLAARSGASVVALDQDLSALGKVWRMARAEGLSIVPLYANISRPSPATGWRNAECRSLLDRLRGRFDAVLMLAVLHHLLVSERVPLSEVVSLAAELTTDLLVIEFVAPADELFARIARGREHLHEGLDTNCFEHAIERRFRIQEKVETKPGRRWIYVLNRIAGR